MKDKTVSILYYHNAGTTKQLLKLPTPVSIKIIEIIREDGTDIMFGYIDNQLIYFTASHINNFYEQ